MYEKSIKRREKLGKCRKNYENEKFYHKTLLYIKKVQKSIKKKLPTMRLEPAIDGL